MYNWNADLTRLKQHPEKYEKYVLEQRINFGLSDRKLSLELLKKHWDDLHIDPSKKAYLREIVWPNKS